MFGERRRTERTGLGGHAERLASPRHSRRAWHRPLARHLFSRRLHNTCNDSIEFFDLDLLPHSHTADFAAARRTLEEVCERNAHERCRRFDSAPLNISFSAAHRHVEARAEDLAQTRPEFGNASNAMCVVGRRWRTRGLYLDRRSFLMSYDPTQDDADATILGRILGAVVPVCEGINLQYLFSYIDSAGWGCGTKLPHNVTSLLGVMDGAASDLRPGLPLQGVEIHEPVRCLFVIESYPEAMRKIMARNATVGQILRNGWVQLALLHPDSGEVLLFQKGEFVPYQPQAKELPQTPNSAGMVSRLAGTPGLRANRPRRKWPLMTGSFRLRLILLVKLQRCQRRTSSLTSWAMWSSWRRPCCWRCWGFRR